MSIVTLTLNPSLDKSTLVSRVVPDDKLNCMSASFHPGGGGINVARVVKRLGLNPHAMFQSAGPAGQMLEQLLSKDNLEYTTFPTDEWTRENFSAVDESTGSQYRFGFPGPLFSSEEVDNCFGLLKKRNPAPSILVLSGSLSPGIPDDFYAKVCLWAREEGIKVVMDTSGPALVKGVDAGVFLVKPNLKELSELGGKEHISGKEQEEIATSLIDDKKAEIIVVSMGPRGAMMASASGIEYVTSPTVLTKSTVGAGDSMVAGMVWAISQGMDKSEILKYGIACGTATTMNAGTQLCSVKDVKNIYNWISA